MSYPLAPLLGLGLAAAFGAADWVDGEVGRPSVLMLGGPIAAGLVVVSPGVEPASGWPGSPARNF